MLTRSKSIHSTIQGIESKVQQEEMAAAAEGELKLVVDCGNILGEGPVWDERQSALLWIDIEGRRLWRYGGPIQEDGTGGELTSWELPKRPGSFALREQGPGFLFAFEDGFAIYDPTAENPEPPQYLGKEQYVEGDPYHQHGQVRLNDGRCDRQGRFVAGGYNGDEGDAERPWEAKCGVYVVEGSETGGITAREFFNFKVRCANSTAFSPRDGTTVYFADSPSREIWAFDYVAAQGRIKGDSQRVFANVPEPGVPDGSCVDSAGSLYNAEFFSGRMVKYNKDGSVDRVWRAPTASRLTCPCIGGPSMKTVFVTSASVGLEPGVEKGAGGIWAVQVETAGLPETRFRG